MTEFGATIWIHRALEPDIICRFNTLKEGFTYGHAYMTEHNLVLNDNPSIHKTCVYDYYGYAWFADYIPVDSLEHIRKNGYGTIGNSPTHQVALYKGYGLPFDLWSCTQKVVIMPPGLAMTANDFNNIPSEYFTKYKDDRIAYCTLRDYNHWRDLLIASC